MRRILAVFLFASLSACTPSMGDFEGQTGPVGGKADEVGDLPTGVWLRAIDNGGAFTVEEGETVIVDLATDPDAGLGWVVERTDRTFGFPAKVENIVLEESLSTRGVRLTWRTDGLAPRGGTHEVSLEYRKPWDLSSVASDTFTFTVTVTLPPAAPDASAPDASPDADPAPDYQI